MPIGFGSGQILACGDVAVYLLAILCPPLAVLLCGKPIQALLNLLLSLLLYVPGLVHALMVVTERKADKRMDRQTRAFAGATYRSATTKSP